MKDFRRMLPGLLISIVLIGAILYFVDLKAMVAAVKAADYLLLLVVLVLGVLWLFVRALVWRTLLRNRASIKDVFLTLMEGYLLNNFLPFRLGEIGRAFLLSRKSDPSASSHRPGVLPGGQRRTRTGRVRSEAAIGRAGEPALARRRSAGLGRDGCRRSAHVP